MRRIIALLSLLLLGVASNQVITRGYIYSNIGTLYTWSGAAPAWSGSLQNATEGDFCTNVQNNGCAGESALRGITSSQAAAWAVNSTAHSPILANNTFSPTCTSWTLAGVSGTGLFADAPTCPTSGDQGGDGYYSLFSTAISSSCSADGTTTCKGTTSQTVSIAGTPTSQTVSFYYKGIAHTATGDGVNCNPTTGSVTLALAVNGTSITLPTLTLDDTWRSSGNLSITSLVNGSNTITFTTTGKTTFNQGSHLSGGNTLCNVGTYTQNTMGIDTVVLTATY